jgi:hypothetical protein
MKKKILLIAFALALNSVAYSSEPALPPLPPPEIALENSQESKSFWDKFLEFLGFGETPKVEEKKETPTVNPDPTPKVPDLPKIPVSGPLAEETAQPKTPQDETPLVVDKIGQTPITPPAATDKLPKSTINNASLPSANEDPVALKLPEGFEPSPDEEAIGGEKKAIPTPSAPLTEPDNIKAAVEPPSQAQVTALPALAPEASKAENVETPPIITPPSLETESAREQAVITTTIPSSEPKAPEASVQSFPKNTKEPEVKNDKTSTTSLPPENKNIDKAIESESASLPSSNDINKEPNKADPATEINRFRKQLQEHLDQKQNLPQIPKEEVQQAAPPPANNSTGDAEEDAKQIKFMHDEAQVLTLPNDDIVLGELTEEARLELIDFSTYVPMFWEYYNIAKNEPARKAIDDFIKNYDSTFNSSDKHGTNGAFIEAFRDIEMNHLYDLAVLLDHYPILQMTDPNGNNLLHKAVDNNNYSAAKLLIVRGVNLAARNNQGDNAMDIALAKNNPVIINLLKDAGMKLE